MINTWQLCPRSSLSNSRQEIHLKPESLRGHSLIQQHLKRYKSYNRMICKRDWVSQKYICSQLVVRIEIPYSTAYIQDVKFNSIFSPLLLIFKEGLLMFQVKAIVEDARSRGADVPLGGQPSSRGGTFYEPTLLTNVTADMRCSQEEIFGPVCPIIK